MVQLATARELGKAYYLLPGEPQQLLNFSCCATYLNI